MTSRAAPTSGTSSLAGSGSSTWGSTSDPRAAQGRATSIRRFPVPSLIALAALAAAAAVPPAWAGSTLSAEGARPDSAVATLRVETIPSGLAVLVDGVRVGRSPVGPLWVAAKPIRVQALSDDPRRFEAARDTLLVRPAPGEAVTATIDLRPSVLLRTAPEPAAILLQDARAGGGDSLIGETPLRLLPARLDHRIFRLLAPEHADTAISGESILALASSGGPVTVALRRTAPHRLPEPPKALPLVRRRWFQIALIGAGAALTGTSAILRHEADGWYDRYLESSDPDEIPRLYDRTVHYDRLAGAALGSGQALLTAGIFLLVTSVTR